MSIIDFAKYFIIRSKNNAFFLLNIHQLWQLNRPLRTFFIVGSKKQLLLQDPGNHPKIFVTIMRIRLILIKITIKS